MSQSNWLKKTWVHVWEHVSNSFFKKKKVVSKKLILFGKRLEIDYNKKNDNFKLKNSL